jgi:hypothetical protein
MPTSDRSDICIVAKVPSCGCIVGISIIPQYVTPSSDWWPHYVDQSLRKQITEWTAGGLDVEIAEYEASISALRECHHSSVKKPSDYLHTLSYQKLEQIDTLCKAVEVLLMLR